MEAIDVFQTPNANGGTYTTFMVSTPDTDGLNKRMQTPGEWKVLVCRT